MKRTFYFIFAVLLAIPAYVASQDLPTAPSGNQYYQDQGNPAGKVDNITYGSSYKARVYTPPGYDEGKTYSSMYLLHGMGGSEASWHDNDLYAHIQLDNLIADGRVDGFVMIFTRNDYNNWNFTNILIDQLMPYIEQNYSVSKEGKYRALGGLSMGCGQTQSIAGAHVEKFHYLMPTSCGGTFRFSNNAAAVENIELALITCGEREGDLVTGMANSLTSIGVSKDLVYTWKAPGGAHDRNTWRPTFWNFAQMAYDRGFTGPSGVINDPVSSKPNALNCSIHQNPYSNTITIRFTLPQTTMITVTLFTIDGTRVRTLASGEKINGKHILEWDGKDTYGKNLSTGIYMLRLTTGGDVVQRKIMLIR